MSANIFNMSPKMLPNVALNAYAVNTVDFDLTNPNGTNDDEPIGNQISANFNGLGLAAEGNAIIRVVEDNYGSEITWQLTSNNGNIIAQGGPYVDGNAGNMHQENVTLVPGECYTFLINDSYGDGIGAPGYYMVQDVNMSTIASISSNFTSEERTDFYTDGFISAIYKKIRKLLIFGSDKKISDVHLQFMFC